MGATATSSSVFGRLRDMPARRLGVRALQLALGALLARLLWRLGRLIHNILTSVDQSTRVAHNAVPPPEYRQPFQAASIAYVKQHHPELTELAERGSLLVLQPANLLKELLSKQQQQEEQEEALEPSRTLAECLAAPPPDVILLVGTIHVSLQSAEDVTRIIKAVRPSRVVLELCAPRVQALLIDPYDDLDDLEPSADRAAAAAAAKHSSISSVLQAALASRDHNILQTIMTGLYSLVEKKLEVSAGVEFIAARRALIELAAEEQQQQQQQQQREGADADAAAAVAGGGPRAPPPGSWLSRCIAGDRPLMQTLLGLWGALGPWKRLKFIGDITCAFGMLMDEETVASLHDDDMVELLIKECGEAYPEVLGPLVHDRNWVLATTAWRAAQAAQAAGHRAPVLAIVGRGHLNGIAYVTQRLVGLGASLVAQQKERLLLEQDGEQTE